LELDLFWGLDAQGLFSKLIWDRLRTSVNARITIRTVLLLSLVLPLSSAMAHAQRGGGGMGRGGGGDMGGGMGGDRGMMPRHDDRMDMMHPIPHIQTEPVIALPGRWWDDHRTIKSLKLRPEQQQRMDAIFESNVGTLMTLYTNLQREQQKFVDMPREQLQDETKVFAQIDRIEDARAALEKERFHTLMQIRKEMDPKQMKELDKKIAEAVGQ
jgi:Spy/CpxP family protein refolding chaperone